MTSDRTKYSSRSPLYLKDASDELKRAVVWSATRYYRTCAQGCKAEPISSAHIQLPRLLQSNGSITPSITMAGMPGPVNAFYCGRQKLDCSCAALLGVCMTLQKISCEDARACRGQQHDDHAVQ